MSNTNEIREALAIDFLKKGDDLAIRQYYASRIEDVLAQSAKGYIGWGDFTEEIENLICKMKEQCEEHWPRD